MAIALLVLLLGVTSVLSIPVNVMLPLDTVTKDGKIANVQQLTSDLAKMKQSGLIHL